MGDKSKKASFRKACKPFSMLHGQLMYNNTKLVIFSTKRQNTIIIGVHKGLGYDPKAKAMASHCGRDSTIQKISNRFFWHNIRGDVEEFIKKCDQCQKQRKIKKVSSELHSIPIKTQVMSQIGIDICSLSDVDGFKHLGVCIDILVPGRRRNPLKIKVPPPLLSSFVRLYVGLDV